MRFSLEQRMQQEAPGAGRIDTMVIAVNALGITQIAAWGASLEVLASDGHHVA
jgi:hypothetical protein